MTASTTDVAGIPVGSATPVITYSPVVLEVPGRPVPLEVKISVPATGGNLPVIVLSHGHGMAWFLSSLRGYGPLVDFWAARGFVVIQPTHLDSTALGLREADHPEAPLYWRTRPTDVSHVLDHLDDLEDAFPALRGRMDRDRIAVAGHSLGGHTASLLLGARTTDPTDGTVVQATDPRIKAGLILAAPGENDGLSEFAAEHYPMLRGVDFSTMTGEALVVAGDKDLNPMFSDRLSYRWDAYTRSPGPKTLLTVFGGEHILGGISGYDAAETTDADPERVALVAATGWAYLRSALTPGDIAWDQAVAALESAPAPLAQVAVK